MAMLASGLPEVVGDDEDLVRFILSSGQFNATGAKPSAFLPNPRDRETSVYRHEREPPEGLRRLAEPLVAKSGRSLKASALIKAGRVREAALSVIADEPPQKHAAIRGWPWPDDPELKKSRQVERAAFLAQHSELIVA